MLPCWQIGDPVIFRDEQWNTLLCIKKLYIVFLSNRVDKMVTLLTMKYENMINEIYDLNFIQI